MEKIAAFFYWEPNMLSNPQQDYDLRNNRFFIYKDIAKEFDLEIIDWNKANINEIKTVITIEGNNTTLGNIPVPKGIILGEPPTVMPMWYNEDLSVSNLILSQYDYIFILNHKTCDNIRTFPFTMPVTFTPQNTIPFSQKESLCCLLTHGNKQSSHPLDLYKERHILADWFANYHPQELNIFGHEWNGHPCSRGVGYDSKKNIISRHKFDITYENTKDMPGCISERIIDCFLGGSVPIYWGAPDITDYIPANCFINRNNFINTAELYEYLISMPENMYNNYIKQINIFINNPQNIFRAENSAREILKTISCIINKKGIN